MYFYCSIEFDRDDQLFATAGVSRRIKVFDFASVRSWFTGVKLIVLIVQRVASHKWEQVCLRDMVNVILLGFSTR